MLTDDELHEAVNQVGEKFNRFGTDMSREARLMAVLSDAGISREGIDKLIDWILREYYENSPVVVISPELPQMVFHAILSGIAVGKKIAEVTSSGISAGLEEND
jgi:hypothetical protein